MRLDDTPLQQSIAARLSRRRKLTIAAASAVSSFAGRTRSAAATEPAWALELTATTRALLPQTTIPGAIVGVWQDGESGYVEAFGVQDPATGPRPRSRPDWVRRDQKGIAQRAGRSAQAGRKDGDDGMV
jgi:hypothetical protein